MALRKIIKLGDEVLRKKSRIVDKFDDRLFQLLDDMGQTLDSIQGLGLAAPQVGVLKRICLVRYDDKKYEVINPVILSQSGETIDNEGCLSVVGYRGILKRADNITVQFVDRNNKVQTVEASGYNARIFLHEIDHLDGIMFVDKMIKRVDLSKTDDE